MKRWLFLVALIGVSGQATAAPLRSAGPPQGDPLQSSEPVAVNSVNVTLGQGRLSLCFWGSALYSPGSHIDSYDATKKASACFHCNADGTWDTPCQ